jgi:hypothetical protein
MRRSYITSPPWRLLGVTDQIYFTFTSEKRVASVDKIYQFQDRTNRVIM